MGKKKKKFSVARAESRATLSAKWAGPLPPPASLEHFERIVPGAAERIVAMSEAEQKHRHKMENDVIRAHRRGQWMGLCVALAALAGAGYAVYQGTEWPVPVALAGAPVAIIVATLVGRRS